MKHWQAADEADLPEGGHGDVTLKLLAKCCDTPDSKRAPKKKAKAA